MAGVTKSWLSVYSVLVYILLVGVNVVKGLSSSFPKNETTQIHGFHILKTNYRTSCCENGGTCFLGSFCKCPKKYYGRYCQHKHRRRPCGVIEHRVWEQVGCNMCYCYDGILSCLPQVFDDIEDCDRNKTEIFIEDYRQEWREKRKELKAKGIWDSRRGRPRSSASNSMKSHSQLLLISCVYLMCHMFRGCSTRI